MLNEREKISERIKKERIKAGYTQEQFAEKIGITPQHFSCIELGKSIPSLPVFFSISKVLNLTLEDFGIRYNEQGNYKLDRFIDLIKTFNDNELECYYNVIQNLIKNFNTMQSEQKVGQKKTLI